MTKEQQDCQFCHGKLRKSLISFQSGSISVEGNSCFTTAGITMMTNLMIKKKRLIFARSVDGNFRRKA